MLETMLITFREGLEAFLIVAIMLAYVTKTGRESLKKPIYAGVLVALFISATTGWHVAALAQDPVWEGMLALTAGVMVASFTVYVMRTAKNIRADIHGRIDSVAKDSGTAAEIGVFFFTILMIAREGMETALMLGALSTRADSTAMIAGGLAGLALVAGIGYLWVKQAHKVNLKVLFQVTGVFLILFAIHLFIYGVHELSEMTALPLLGPETQGAIHVATEPFGHDGVYAQILTYGLLAVPAIWLGIAALRTRMMPVFSKS